MTQQDLRARVLEKMVPERLDMGNWSPCDLPGYGGYHAMSVEDHRSLLLNRCDTACCMAGWIVAAATEEELEKVRPTGSIPSLARWLWEEAYGPELADWIEEKFYQTAMSFEEAVEAIKAENPIPDAIDDEEFDD